MPSEDWYYAVRPARNLGDPASKYVAWCARTPDLGIGPIDRDLDDCHVRFAATPEAALAGLRAEMDKHDQEAEG